jgi:hypothetical protein
VNGHRVKVPDDSDSDGDDDEVKMVFDLMQQRFVPVRKAEKEKKKETANDKGQDYNLSSSENLIIKFLLKKIKNSRMSTRFWLKMLNNNDFLKCCFFMPKIILNLSYNYLYWESIEIEHYHSDYLIVLDSPNIMTFIERYCIVDLEKIIGFLKKARGSDDPDVAKYILTNELKMICELFGETPYTFDSNLEILIRSVIINNSGGIKMEKSTLERLILNGVCSERQKNLLFYSELRKLRYLWENKRTIMVFKFLLTLFFCFSLFSTLGNYSKVFESFCWNLLSVPLFLLVVLGIFIDKWFLNQFQKEQSFNCKNYYFGLKCFLEESENGNIVLAVGTINNVPHIQFYYHDSVPLGFCGLSRYRFGEELNYQNNYNYNNCGYNLWLLDFKNFSINGNRCETEYGGSTFGDMEYEFFNFQFVPAPLAEEILTEVFKEELNISVDFNNFRQNGLKITEWNKIQTVYVLTMKDLKINYKKLHSTKRYANLYAKLRVLIFSKLDTILKRELISVPVEQVEYSTTVEDIETEEVVMVPRYIDVELPKPYSFNTLVKYSEGGDIVEDLDTLGIKDSKSVRKIKKDMRSTINSSPSGWKDKGIICGTRWCDVPEVNKKIVRTKKTRKVLDVVRERIIGREELIYNNNKMLCLSKKLSNLAAQMGSKVFKNKFYHLKCETKANMNKIKKQIRNKSPGSTGIEEKKKFIEAGSVRRKTLSNLLNQNLKDFFDFWVESKNVKIIKDVDTNIDKNWILHLCNHRKYVNQETPLKFVNSTLKSTKIKMDQVSSKNMGKLLCN